VQLSKILSTSLVTGNVALDLALLFLAALWVFHFTRKTITHVHAVKGQKERTRRMTLSLSKDDQIIASLRQELQGARQQTQEVLTPYLEGLDQVQKLAAAIEEQEIDSQHDALKEQLDQKSSKTRHPGG
jgi:hypothetical protein